MSDTFHCYWEEGGPISDERAAELLEQVRKVANLKHIRWCKVHECASIYQQPSCRRFVDNQELGYTGTPCEIVDASLGIDSEDT